MKKTLLVVFAFVLCVSLLAGCETKVPGAATSAAPAKNVIKPLDEVVDVKNLNDCTVAVSLGEGDAFVDGNGKMIMKVKVYTYDLYDMVDISALKENDVIIRLGEEMKITELERLDSGLVRINGGEENGGFDLISNDSTVYYEIGMSDIKAYYELGEATLPVSDEFEYIDESEPEAEEKVYYPGDFLTDDSGIDYSFSPNNTSVVIENGVIIKMKKVYTP